MKQKEKKSKEKKKKELTKEEIRRMKKREKLQKIPHKFDKKRTAVRSTIKKKCPESLVCKVFSKKN